MSQSVGGAVVGPSRAAALPLLIGLVTQAGTTYLGESPAMRCSYYRD